MLILALDASTAAVTVALARVRDAEREVLAEVYCGNRGASEVLLHSVHSALGLAGERLEAVERIVVGTGPGTFTGIRIAVATAHALSSAGGIGLCPGSSLAALAAPALPVSEAGVLAVLDAKRGQVFAQEFSSDGREGEVLCLKPGDLARWVPSGGLLVGDGAVRYREELSKLGRIPPDASPLNRVTAAGHVLASGLEPSPLENVLPLYVREPDAEVRRGLNPWSRS